MSAINEGLELCPFCGPEGAVKRASGPQGYHNAATCIRCGAIQQYVEKWNNRPIENALRAELEQVKREREKFSLMCNLIAKMTVEIIRENDCVFPRGWQYEKNIIEWAEQKATKSEVEA